MAATVYGCQTSAMTRLRRESRRQIPLTAFTLLTVPEEPMLSEYLRRVDAIDVSLMKRSFDSETGFGRETSTSKASQRELEVELDKFMGALTATESPDAVIKTIVASKSCKQGARKSCA